MILRSDNPMLRALMMLLYFEVVVFLLALPGMLLVDQRDTALSIVAVAVASVLALVAGARAKTAWGQWLGWFVQVVAIAMGVLTSMMYAVGIIFAFIWVMCIVLGKKMENSPGAAKQ